jgi:hypothetical protein
MHYAGTTPANVRRAVAIYVARRRWVGVAAALVAAIATAIVLLLAFIVADRYAQLPQALRDAGPRLVEMALLAGVVGAIVALVRRHDPFGVAVRLDQAFPHHLDRWSSSLDLADQIAAGRNVGDQASLDRLFADTEALPSKNAGSIVSTQGLRMALIALTVAASALLFVGLSPAFDFPLLCRRFVHPRANLPRDGATRIVVVDVNGQPFTGEMPGPFAEGSPLNLRVELRRKPGLFAFGRKDRVIDDADQLAPRLERWTEGGPAISEFTRAGSTWTFTQPRLEKSLVFRVGVDDGLTRIFSADVIPRIKLTRIDSAVRFPRYAHVKDQSIAPLQGNRISALTDSVAHFELNFDRPFTIVTATYEAMKSEKDPAAAAEIQASGATPQDTFHDSSRRTLRVQKRGETAARFTLPIDASGILRISAVGANGLGSEEWVGAVEAVPDAPPRIVVTGIDPVMTVAPGETVSFQYQAEDDLAVTDIVMDWSVAGGIHSSELGGEEYLRNNQLGQKIVAGQELIQRMNYKFYATEPFQFFLTAIDSKGQESHTETYRIHVQSDDYATRFDRGMELLKDTGAYQTRFLQQLGGLTGQLNIIATASGGAKTWDPKLDAQFDNFLRTAQNYDDPWFFVKPLTLRYGGIPYRLNQALQMLMAPPDALATRADFLALGMSLKTTGDLPAAIGQIRSLIESQRPIVDAWGKAVAAEKARFLPEQLLNQARGPAARLAALSHIQQPPDVAAANLKFYLAQIDAWLIAAAPLAADDPEFPPLLDALKHAREQGAAPAIIAALQTIVQKLSSRDLATDDALPALAGALAKTLAEMSDANDRYFTLIARMVLTSGQNELLAPARTMALAQPWLTDAPTTEWDGVPANPADTILMAHQAWEALRIYRADLLAGRFDLNPQEGADRLSVLREFALSTKEELRQIPADGIESAARDRLNSVLDRLINPGAAALDAGLPADLSGAIRAVGVDRVAALGAAAQTMIEPLTAAMRKTADEYDRHADAVEKESATPPVDAETIHPGRLRLLDDAARLQTRTEGLESLYRAVKMAIIESRLLKESAAPPWSDFEALHAAQIGVSLAASQAGESVTRIHVELSAQPGKSAEKYGVIARNARQLAARLRSTAELLTAARRGEPVKFDYERLMKDARAEGSLAALKEEYELVAAHAFTAGSKTMADAEAKLNKTALARIVRGEQALAPLTEMERRIKEAAAGKPPEMAAALDALRKRLSSDPDAPTIDALPAALNEASAAPRDEPVKKLPALNRRVQAVSDALTNLGESFRDQARLPAISTTSRQNRRFTTRDLPNVWVIGGVIEGFDRRWLHTMRDLELSLTRTMLEVGRAEAPGELSSPAPADSTDLKLQYARMVEWRARNFANDRRRNQGISLLAAGAGPTLRLPEHIAEEFLRARNLQSPQDFKPRIESYYEEIYHDLAR